MTCEVKRFVSKLLKFAYIMDSNKR